MKEPGCEHQGATTTTDGRWRIVIRGAALNEDQAAGRSCSYCPLTFAPLDPAPAPAGVQGVLCLAAHRSCIDRISTGPAPARPYARDPRAEGCVAATGRSRERTSND